MNLTDFRVLSFDCYGTLIDWETGITNGLRPLVTRSSKELQRDEVLQSYSRHEAAVEEETPAMPYPEVLKTVYGRLARGWNIKTGREEAEAFAASIHNWPAFADSPSALQYLKKHYKLVILSNVDRESFKASNAKLQVDFDYIFTAQDIGSYKPNPRNFEYLIEKLGKAGYEKPSILHTAQSLFHDHLPANRFGLASAWIDRRHEQDGFGATPAPASLPHYNFRFTSLGKMAAAHRRSVSS
jgi:2-haloalkanoic acid dehalogenase type II